MNGTRCKGRPSSGKPPFMMIWTMEQCGWKSEVAVHKMIDGEIK
jgi:hypothetical protein